MQDSHLRLSYELEPIHYSAHFNLISFPTHFINHITEFTLVTSVIFILLIQWVLFSSHLNWLVGSIQYICIFIFIYHTNTLWVTVLCWVQYLSFYFHDATIYWFFTLHCGCNLSYSLIFLDLKMYELIRILSASSPGDFFTHWIFIYHDANDTQIYIFRTMSLISNI